MAGQLIILGTPEATAIPKEVVRQEESELYAHICLARFFRLAAFASLFSLLVSLKPRLMTEPIRVLLWYIGKEKHCEMHLLLFHH